LLSLFVCLSCSRAAPALLSFPTRRSSDLHYLYPGRRLHHTRLWPSSTQLLPFLFHRISSSSPPHPPPPPPPKKSDVTRATALWRDRKSTRLNSSHVSISYAVFCLKKKNTL